MVEEEAPEVRRTMGLAPPRPRLYGMLGQRLDEQLVGRGRLQQSCSGFRKGMPLATAAGFDAQLRRAGDALLPLLVALQLLNVLCWIVGACEENCAKLLVLWLDSHSALLLIGCMTSQ